MVDAEIEGPGYTATAKPIDVSDRKLDYTQASFLDLAEQDPGTMKVVVFHDGHGQYEAWINGGWWVAKGPTVKTAIRAAVARCQKEIGHLERKESNNGTN